MIDPNVHARAVEAAETESRVRFTAEQQRDALAAEVAALREALEFYEDPETYIAIGFFPDRPCGAFMDDFEAVEDDPVRPGAIRPGKRARAALASPSLLAERIADVVRAAETWESVGHTLRSASEEALAHEVRALYAARDGSGT
jgi:hypothetical protein